MNSIESTTIYISKEEQVVIKDLVTILDNMSMSLLNYDYVNIFRAIANGDTGADVNNNILISYE